MTSVDRRPAVKVDGEIRLQQAGQSVLLKARVELQQADARRDQIMINRQRFGIVKEAFRRPGYRRKDLDSASEGIAQAKERIALLTEIVNGNYRFTRFPETTPFKYAPYYEIIGKTKDGRYERLWEESREVPRKGGGGYGSGSGPEYRDECIQYIDGDTHTGSEITQRVRRVAGLLYEIYGEAGFQIRHPWTLEYQKSGRQS